VKNTLVSTNIKACQIYTIDYMSQNMQQNYSNLSVIKHINIVHLFLYMRNTRQYVILLLYMQNSSYCQHQIMHDDVKSNTVLEKIYNYIIFFYIYQLFISKLLIWTQIFGTSFKSGNWPTVLLMHILHNSFHYCHN
jgi:hypothetical protein